MHSRNRSIGDCLSVGGLGGQPRPDTTTPTPFDPQKFGLGGPTFEDLAMTVSTKTQSMPCYRHDTRIREQSGNG